MLLKKVVRIYFSTQVFLLSSKAFSSSGASGAGLPWESAIDKIQQSLFYVGGSLILIGFLWAGYAFLISDNKEAGFRRLIGTVIGGAIILGAKGIVSTVLGAQF
ncbi:TrbC/VirB2 family protein [Silvanigrella aquatica]|uniref:Conjugal transfer protein TrbC n=1 Tax=Silvanigrella aquatica TaxID=1915309 RepID=A0A1L4D4V4_9BACT|nr:TrbC/VirB2 family protein [Silvanigrella aquatica]APJ05217.1 hypothetical protein AXG55_14435 [Silvanigrella aquatica]